MRPLSIYKFLEVSKAALVIRDILFLSLQGGIFMNFANKVKADLLGIISKMSQSPWLFSKNPKTDFSRKRKLEFSSLLHLCISMETGTVRDELLKYFSYDPKAVSNAAFFQQREKLIPETFPFLFHQFSELYPCTLYKNKYQLLACDGSSFTYTRNPSDEDCYFSPNKKSANGYNQVHLVALFDILSKRYCDCIVQPIRKKNEFQALCQLIDRHATIPGSTPIYIADRGFHSYNVFAHAIEHNAYFVIRAKDINTKRLLGKDMPPKLDTFDISINRILTRSNSKKNRIHPELEDQYRPICKEVTFDYIDTADNTEYPISLRVLRLKITEDTYENIITNLPADEFNEEDIKELYRMRWGIETSFRELKHTIGALNFHSKKREYIEMEIWCRLLLYNFCSIITGHVVLQQKNRKHVYQVNYSIAYKACHYFLGLHCGENPPDIESLIGQNILPIRHDRKYARQHRFRVPVNFCYRFK